MAPATSSSSSPVADDIPIEELVFSCSICQATVSEVYATVESNHGFHSGSGDEDGLVTKMWIASCSHVTCGKHLENGGLSTGMVKRENARLTAIAAPFHPQGEPRRAPCPKCLNDTQDSSPRELYGIRGLAAGKLDGMIPAEWLQCPAVNLDSSMPGMEAVRFQYMALCHYSMQARKHWKTAQNHQSTMEAAYSKERKQRRQIQSEVLELKSKVEKLDKAEAKLQKWDNRTPYINHYLGIFPKMLKDIADQDDVLRRHGYVIPERKYFFEPNEASQGQENRQPQHMIAPFSGVPTAGVREDENSSSARKRKREEFQDEGFDASFGQRAELQASSRDMMPPPLPQARPVQRIMPPSSQSLRRQAQFKVPGSRQPIQVYEENPSRLRYADDNTQPPESLHSAFGRLSTSHTHQDLPFRPAQHHSMDSRSGLQLRNAASDGRYDAQPFAQPSLQRPRLQDGGVRGQNDVSSAHHYDERARYGQDPRMVSEEGTNNLVTQQRGFQTRQPLQELSGSYQTSRIPQVQTPSPQKSSQRPSASVISPFFKCNTDAVLPPSLLQRPPSRGHTHLQPQHAALTHTATSGHQMGRPQSRHFQRYNESHSTTKPSAAVSSRQAERYQQPYQQAQYRPDTMSRYQQPFAVPQTPRNSQGFLQRPDQAAPALSAVSRPHSKNTSRSRVSLPPGTGFTMPMAGSQDNTLSQIPGVRGVTSQRGLSSYQRPAQGPDFSRSLFSSAGGRRSVRR